MGKPDVRGQLPRRGFTAIEFLVLLGIVIILASIFVPYALKLREESRRIRCRDNLQLIFQAMQAYARDNSDMLPAAGRHASDQPLTVFTRDPEPTNSVTGSLWLLVRGGYLTSTRVFLCPGRDGEPALTDSSAADFASAGNLGYSYASPFGADDSYKLTETMRSGFVVLADINPGATVTVAHDAPPTAFAAVNSPSHRRAGQNVLYPYGSAEWHITPYCGMNNDNIYTVRGSPGATQPSDLPATHPGVLDLRVLPSVHDDSFLLPTARSVNDDRP